MPKTGGNCCIPGCDNTPKSTGNFNKVPMKFYPSPNQVSSTFREKEKRQQWIDAVGIKNEDGSPWKPTQKSRICGAHFVSGEKSEEPLGASYIPTLFPESHETLNITKQPKEIARNLKKAESTISSPAMMPSSTTTTNAIEGASTSHPEVYSTLDIVKQEVFPFLIEPKQEMEIDDLPIDYVFTKSIECQVDLPEDRLRCLEGNYFVCNMCVENDVCTAEVQTNIVSRVDQTVECDSSRDVINRRDVACGPCDPTELQSQGFLGIDSIKNDSELIDFCGITFATFDVLLSLLPDTTDKNELDARNRLLIFLMKLKLGLSDLALAVLFGINESIVTKIFVDTIQCLPILLEEYIYWPTKEMVKQNLPHVFKKNYKNCRVIVECVEISLEIPSSDEESMLLYTSCGWTFIKKFLLAYAPNGFVCYKSKCYGGGTSDEIVANDSEFLDFIEPGDMVLVDERFPDIKASIEKRKATFFKQVEETNKISSMRNHMIRCMDRIRTFNSLSFLPTDMLPYIDSIIHICLSLVNLQSPMSQSE